jgi:hypothetical protein
MLEPRIVKESVQRGLKLTQTRTFIFIIWVVVFLYPSCSMRGGKIKKVFVFYEIIKKDSLQDFRGYITSGCLNS